jgi:hypothetical protein
MGTANYFHGSELATLKKESGGPHAVKKHWTYLTECAERNDAFKGL